MEYKWTVLSVTTIGILMAGIDTRIIVIGLPQVAQSLHADAEQAVWFTQAYVFASTVTILLIGRITDIYGRVKVYNVGFVIFTIGSLLTGLSQSPAEVITFRAFQGVGAAILITNSVALITDAAVKQDLGMLAGINQVAFRVGAMAGLTLSGVILSFLDWRFLFLMNIPVGIVGTFWAHRALKEMAKVERTAKIDWLGFVGITIAIGSLLLGLTYAAYQFSSPYIVYLFFGLSAVALVLFILRERSTRYPLLDLSLFKIHEFTGGVIAQLLNSIAWGAVLLLLSLYFQLGRGYSPFQAGITLLPFDIAYLAIGPLSGKLSDRFGQLPFTTSGLVVQSAALFLLSTVGATAPLPLIILYMVIFGIGLGLFSSPNISSIMGSVPKNRRGIASAVRAMFFQSGLTISLNLAVIFITFIVPYHIISTIISSTNPSSISESDTLLFIRGLQGAYPWLGAINLLAIIPSVLRRTKGGGGTSDPTAGAVDG